jgi:hypothetical protein
MGILMKEKSNKIYLFLLDDVHLPLVHAKVGMTVQQLECPRMSIVAGHDRERQLHILILLLACLVLQGQNALYIDLQQRDSVGLPATGIGKHIT